MPYKNLPKNLWAKMDRCVRKVMKRKGFKPFKGKTVKESAIAVCYVSIKGEK